MPNNGKALTNIAFRKKILEVIDKLKNQNPTSLVRHTDDFEGLNEDTFKVGMSALVDAIPTGGGGGGAGDAGYVVSFSVNDEGIVADKTISDIKEHAANGEMVFGNLYLQLPIDSSMPDDAYIYIYGTFDFQLLGAILEGAEYPIGGCLFTNRGLYCTVLGGRDISPDPSDIDYFSNVLRISGSVDEETGDDVWTLSLETAEDEDEIALTDISDIPSYGMGYLGHMYQIVATCDATDISSSENTAAAIYRNGQYSDSSDFYVLRYLFESLIDPDFLNMSNSEYGYGIRTGLAGKQINIKSGNAFIWIRPSQLELQLSLRISYDGSIYENEKIRGIFNINRFEYSFGSDGSTFRDGILECSMDEDDYANNRIIKHIIHMETHAPFINVSDNAVYYKRVYIPYTKIIDTPHTSPTAWKTYTGDNTIIS